MVDGPVGLAHRRLAIVTSTPASSRCATRTAASLWCTTARSTTTPSSGRARGAAAIAIGRAATPKPSCTSTRKRDRCRGAPAGHVRLCHLGSHRIAAAARARPAGHQAALLRCTDTELLFGSEIKAVLPRAPFGRRSTRRCCPSFSRRASSRRRTRSSAGFEAAAGSRALVVAGRRRSRTRRYWQLPARPVGPRQRIHARGDGLRARLEAAVAAI